MVSRVTSHPHTPFLHYSRVVIGCSRTNSFLRIKDAVGSHGEPRALRLFSSDGRRRLPRARRERSYSTRRPKHQESTPSPRGTKGSDAHRDRGKRTQLAVYNPLALPGFTCVAARQACVDGGARERLFEGSPRRTVSIKLGCCFTPAPCSTIGLRVGDWCVYAKFRIMTDPPYSVSITRGS